MEILLPCFTNFTMFPTIMYNGTQSIIYDNVSQYDCIQLCDYNNDCNGLNYIPVIDTCHLFLTDIFYTSYMVSNSNSNAEFFMKSHQQCFRNDVLSSRYIYFVGGLIGLFCILFVLYCCKSCKSRKSIRMADTQPLLLNIEVEVPPAYNPTI
jgi:hypothetical protein